MAWCGVVWRAENFALALGVYKQIGTTGLIIEKGLETLW